jgi:SAM-dependent methyltransferase
VKPEQPPPQPPPGTRPGAFSAADWDARYAVAELVWTAEPNRFVVEESAGLPPGRALDLACGEGRNAVWLTGRGWTVTGVDFSRVALDKAEALAGEAGVRVGWVLADVVTWSPPGTYDLVLLAYLQLPRPQRQAVLATARSAVAPGGSLLVVAHDRRNLAEGVGGPQDPDVLWTPADALLDGFEVLRAETAPRPVAAGTALDTVVHLRAP